MNPNVFVSHATEDKDRFVRSFGIALRKNGINAWVDEWEIAPGDSLVDKIYNEGIKNAEAFIVVISKHSIEKSWVKEELNAAVVKKIQKGAKIIPVVIDNCEVPEPLKPTLWIKIDDLTNYDAELQKIINSVFNYSDKPPLGMPPQHVLTNIDRIVGLTKIDTIVLKIIGDIAIYNDNFLAIDNVQRYSDSEGISHQSLMESLEILDGEHYIELHRFIGGPPSSFALEYRGFEVYAKTFVAGYDSIQKEVISQIINYEQNNEASIASSINQPINLVRHILYLLMRKSYIKAVEENGGLERIYIYEVSPKLKRLLEGF
jgi:TIR domain.